MRLTSVAAAWAAVAMSASGLVMASRNGFQFLPAANGTVSENVGTRGNSHCFSDNSCVMVWPEITSNFRGITLRATHSPNGKAFWSNDPSIVLTSFPGSLAFPSHTRLNCFESASTKTCISSWVTEAKDLIRFSKSVDGGISWSAAETMFTLPLSEGAQFPFTAEFDMDCYYPGTAIEQQDFGSKQHTCVVVTSLFKSIWVGYSRDGGNTFGELSSTIIRPNKSGANVANPVLLGFRPGDNYESRPVQSGPSARIECSENQNERGETSCVVAYVKHVASRDPVTDRRRELGYELETVRSKDGGNSFAAATPITWGPGQEAIREYNIVYLRRFELECHDTLSTCIIMHIVDDGFVPFRTADFVQMAFSDDYGATWGTAYVFSSNEERESRIGAIECFGENYCIAAWTESKSLDSPLLKASMDGGKTWFLLDSKKNPVSETLGDTNFGKQHNVLSVNGRDQTCNLFFTAGEQIYHATLKLPLKPPFSNEDPPTDNMLSIVLVAGGVSGIIASAGTFLLVRRGRQSNDSEGRVGGLRSFIGGWSWSSSQVGGESMTLSVESNGESMISTSSSVSIGATSDASSGPGGFGSNASQGNSDTGFSVVDDVEAFAAFK